MSKKDDVLESALNLLVSNGIHASPMSEIAKAAGTGMGTIYHYFANKEAIINEIYVDIKRKEALLFPTFTADQPIKTQYEEYYSITIRYYIDHPQYFQFMEQMRASPIITLASQSIGYESVMPVIQMIEEGQRQRIIKDIALQEILQFIGGAILSYLKWYFTQSEVPIESISNHMQMVWDGIKE